MAIAVVLLTFALVAALVLTAVAAVNRSERRAAVPLQRPSSPYRRRPGQGSGV